MNPRARSILAVAAALVAMAVVPGMAAANTSLPSGQTIADGQSVVSGSHTLAMQSDGNLVLYVGQQSTWQSTTAGNPGAWAVMQGDGNVVVYTAAGRALWQSGTAGNPGAYLVVQDDGNTVVYSASGRALWATNTAAPTRTSAASESAAQWAERHIGQVTTTENRNRVNYWSGYCETFVEAAYGNVFMFSSAISDFSYRQARGQIKGGVPPRGALVFYGGGNGDGHVAVSVGGGQVVSTMGYTWNRYPISQNPYNRFSPYLGWALPY